MAKTFKLTYFFKIFNTLICALFFVSVNMGNMTLLTVLGRKSGQTVDCLCAGTEEPERVCIRHLRS